MKLAYSIGFAFATAAKDYGWKPPPDAMVPPDEVSYHYLRSLTGVQPKASKLPPVHRSPWLLVDLYLDFK